MKLDFPPIETCPKFGCERFLASPPLAGYLGRISGVSGILPQTDQDDAQAAERFWLLLYTELRNLAVVRLK